MAGWSPNSHGSGVTEPGNEQSTNEVNRSPIANAGPDKTVYQAGRVRLSGRRSSDPDGDDLSYHWRQTAGIAVVLSDASAVDPVFVAPEGGAAEEILEFELVVRDDELDSTDRVQVVVTEQPDGFLPVMAAALSAGQFSVNNPWTADDLKNENIWEELGYQGIVDRQPAGRIGSYTTLVHQYQARRRQCEEDYQEKHLGSEDRRCYPTLSGGAATTRRYGYYCGGDYPPFDPFAEKAPEPLDGVDYCCRLHDANVWNVNRLNSNECGIVMCLGKLSAMPKDVLDVLPDVAEAREYWYGWAASKSPKACPGNQTNYANLTVTFGP